MHLFGRVREPDEMAGIWRQLLLTRATDDDVSTRRARTAGFVSAMLIWLLRERLHRRRAGQRRRGRRRLEGQAGARRATKEEILATAGSRYTYCANPLALREAKEQGFNRLALVGMGCQTSSPPIDVGPQGRQGGQAVPVQHRPAVLEDVRRRHLPRAVRGQVRPEEAGHGEDEHQGRLPDLDEGRLVPRDRPQGVPPVDPRGLQELPRLRRRARRHLDRRHRRGQRLDAHDRAHRARRGGHRPDDRRRRRSSPAPPRRTRWR